MFDPQFEDDVIYRFVGGLDSGWRQGELAEYAIGRQDENGDLVLIMRLVDDHRIYIGNEVVLFTARLDDVVRDFYSAECEGRKTEPRPISFHSTTGTYGSKLGLEQESPKDMPAPTPSILTRLLGYIKHSVHHA